MKIILDFDETSRELLIDGYYLGVIPSYKRPQEYKEQYPKQNLLEVKAQAIEEAIRRCKSETDDGDWICYVVCLEHEINELRN